MAKIGYDSIHIQVPMTIQHIINNFIYSFFSKPLYVMYDLWLLNLLMILKVLMKDYKYN